MSAEYRVDLHILDHAAVIYNSIENYNPLKHKSHFKSSIDSSQLIANGFNTPEKINEVMNLMLEEIINTKYTFRVKTRSYTDKKGDLKEYFSNKSFELNKETIAAYHNRSFNSDIEFDNIEPHIHLLFDSKHTGKNYYHLKKHLQSVASKYNLVFHFDEEKDRSVNKYQGLMEKCSRFSWFTQKMTNKQLINYVNKKDDLVKNLDLLYDYAVATTNIQFYIKAMNNLKKRMNELNLTFTWKDKELSNNYPIPIDENTNETLIAIANKDIDKLKTLMVRDNFLARDYIKYINNFQSTIIDEFKLRAYEFPKISMSDLTLENMQGKSKIKASSNEKYITFNNAVKSDILEALKYAKNEIELKNILNTFGYENISFRNQNVQGKRKKTGLKFDYNEKSYTVYFNQIDLDYSTISFHLMNNNNSKNGMPNELDVNYKSNIQQLKFFNSYQNKIFKDIYDFESDIDLSRYYISKDNETVKITNKTKDVEILDKINEILTSDKITNDEAKLIVQLMKKKGWTDLSKVDFNDSNKEFIRKIRDNFENDNSK